jgi:hypothetical protein
MYTYMIMKINIWIELIELLFIPHCTLYPWYIKTPAYGILTSYLWYIDPSPLVLNWQSSKTDMEY